MRYRYLKKSSFFLTGSLTTEIILKSSTNTWSFHYSLSGVTLSFLGHPDRLREEMYTSVSLQLWSNIYNSFTIEQTESNLIISVLQFIGKFSNRSLLFSFIRANMRREHRGGHRCLIIYVSGSKLWSLQLTFYGVCKVQWRGPAHCSQEWDTCCLLWTIRAVHELEFR